MLSKYLKVSTILAMILVMSAVVAVQPAGATIPEELDFQVDYVYVVPTDSTNFGTWESSGVLESNGGIYQSYFWAGWNEDGWFVKNLQTTTRYSNAMGTINIKAHMHEVDFEPFGKVDLKGNWVIVDGTGDYASLQGQGEITVKGSFYWSCPPNDFSVTGPCIIATEKLTGQGHFDP